MMIMTDLVCQHYGVAGWNKITSEPWSAYTNLTLQAHVLLGTSTTSILDSILTLASTHKYPPKTC